MSKCINEITKAEEYDEIQYLVGVGTTGAAKLIAADKVKPAEEEEEDTTDGVFVVDSSDYDYGTDDWITALKAALIGGKKVYIYNNAYTGNGNLGNYYYTVQAFSYTTESLDIIYTAYGVYSDSNNVDSQVRCLSFTVGDPD